MHRRDGHSDQGVSSLYLARSSGEHSGRCRCAIISVPWGFKRLSLFSASIQTFSTNESPQAKHAEADPHHARNTMAHFQPPDQRHGGRIGRHRPNGYLEPCVASKSTTARTTSTRSSSFVEFQVIANFHDGSSYIVSSKLFLCRVPGDPPLSLRNFVQSQLEALPSSSAR